MRKEHYTFDNFVISDGNKEACLAAKYVASDSSGQPAFLCICGGGPGTGKTHLLRAIENDIIGSCEGGNVRYVTADDFTSELIAALKDEKKEEFYKKYREPDVLLVDDVHTLAGRKTTQEELFFILKELYDSGKKVVLAVDSAKVQTAEFGKKLREHFEYGDAVTLNAPDLDGRARILENKLKELTEGSRKSYAADDLRDVLEYIAEKESADMRRLTGALARVAACAELLDQEINKKLAEEILDKEDCLSDNAVI